VATTGWSETSTGQAVAQSVMVAGRRWRGRLDARLRDLGQSGARCRALLVLAEDRLGICQAELAERLGIEDPTAVRLVDALQADGLVARRKVASDRRVNLVQLTPEARPLVREVLAVIEDFRAEALGHIDPADLSACVRVLDLMAARLAPRRGASA
jgi:MarR family transcriptional regulator for hemolysin